MSKRTYVLLGLSGASCVLTVIALISGTDIHFVGFMYGPAYSLGLLAALVIASVLIACSKYLGVGICITVALLMWVAVLIQEPMSLLHYGIVICLSLVAFIVAVWRADFDDAATPGRSWRIPFWRSPN